MIRAAKPSEMTNVEREAFIAFVGAAGEVNLGTLSTLVGRAAALVTLHDGTNLIGTAAIKTPGDAHRRRGHARALIAKAVGAIPGHGMYATTKADPMRRMLPEFGFAVQGEAYPSVLSPDIMLTLFGRPAGGEQPPD